MQRLFTLMVPSGSLGQDNEGIYIPAEVLLSKSMFHSVCPATDTVCMLFMEEPASHAYTVIRHYCTLNIQCLLN